MNQNYIHTITLYNRIQASDSEDRKEHWKRIVLHNCFWKAQVNTGFNDTQASVQNTYAVRIPKDDRYLPYAEYKNSPEEHFTVSQGMHGRNHGGIWKDCGTGPEQIQAISIQSNGIL